MFQSRLYFSDQNGILQGYDKEGNGDWTPSGIGGLNAPVVPQSSITALLSPSADAIKVYFFRKGASDFKRPSVAWWNPSTGWRMIDETV